MFLIDVVHDMYRKQAEKFLVNTFIETITNQTQKQSYKINLVLQKTPLVLDSLTLLQLRSALLI